MEPLTFEQRIEALEALMGMMRAADRMAELGFVARAIEMYEDIGNMLSLYRERVA